MASLRVQFGRHLRKMRRIHDMTQEQFSESVGISLAFLSLVERGINAPSFETLERIARVLNVKVRDLFDFRV
jgi:transcriptional regulator with XRE-family HTH domain